MASVRPVRYDVIDRVAVVTIDNPPVNALTSEVWEGIEAAVPSRLRASPEL